MSIPVQLRQSDRTKLPGMRPREAEVFRRWLRLHEDEYDTFDYNHRIGPGRDPGPAYPDNVRKSAVASSQKRLDAVLWASGVPTLIEVKDFALQAATAQLSEYAAVWAASNPDQPRAKLLIVCTGAEPGFAMYANAAGIQVEFVNRP